MVWGCNEFFYEIMVIAESFAKINLGLQVLERLPTGYHKIETGFCFIEWKDRFEVTEAGTWSLEVNDPSIAAGESNLVTRACRVFEKYVGMKKNYRFRILKNIPAGAGLGGGSSNAALTLRILNKLEDAGLSDGELIDLVGFGAKFTAVRPAPLKDIVRLRIHAAFSSFGKRPSSKHSEMIGSSFSSTKRPTVSCTICSSSESRERTL
jgi:hypothetical protein